jgi:uncharacterized protein (DUF2126 family)
VRAEISKRRGAQERIGNRMTHDIRIGVAGQPRFVLVPDSSQKEWRFLATRVHVEAEAKSKLSHRGSPQVRQRWADPRRS